MKFGKGKNHPGWKGGKVRQSGYVYIWVPKHPRACLKKYVKRSVLVAEKALGKILPMRAMVHHVNGIKDDDRNKNLVVCENNSYHTLIHERKKAYIACGNAKWRKCSFCKEYDDPKNMYKHPTQNSVEHRMCKNKYQRELRARRSAHITA